MFIHWTEKWRYYIYPFLKKAEFFLKENNIYSKKWESFEENWHQRNENPRQKQWRNSNGGSNQWNLFFYRNRSDFSSIFNLMFLQWIFKNFRTEIRSRIIEFSIFSQFWFYGKYRVEYTSITYTPHNAFNIISFDFGCLLHLDAFTDRLRFNTIIFADFPSSVGNVGYATAKNNGKN